jgi:hypothetical protein
VSTVIIGCEADFWSRKPISKEQRMQLMRRLKEFVDLSYDSEPTIAKQIRADEGALTGKVKPTFQSLLKIRDFLESQAETGGGIAPIGYVQIRAEGDSELQQQVNHE